MTRALPCDGPGGLSANGGRSSTAPVRTGSSPHSRKRTCMNLSVVEDDPVRCVRRANQLVCGWGRRSTAPVRTSSSPHSRKVTLSVFFSAERCGRASTN